jgi:hypothetical protein
MIKPDRDEHLKRLLNNFKNKKNEKITFNPKLNYTLSYKL